MAGAFDRLHRDVQRKLHEMKWTALNPIQVDAIDHLLGPEPSDCIISAPTAGGKTEAAFLPLLSSLAAQPPGGLGAMYIGPLKALINDQFRRVVSASNSLRSCTRSAGVMSASGSVPSFCFQNWRWRCVFAAFFGRSGRTSFR